MSYNAESICLSMISWLIKQIGINSNLGDTATFKSIKATGVKSICDEYTGTDDNDVEPEKVSSGPSDACIYSESDISE